MMIQKRKGKITSGKLLRIIKGLGTRGEVEGLILNIRTTSYFITEEKMGWLGTHRFVGLVALSEKEKGKVIDRDQKKIWR